jgi:hypothetical protein
VSLKVIDARATIGRGTALRDQAHHPDYATVVRLEFPVEVALTAGRLAREDGIVECGGGGRGE